MKTIYIYKGQEAVLTGRTASRSSELTVFGIVGTPDQVIHELASVDENKSIGWEVMSKLYKLDT